MIITFVVFKRILINSHFWMLAICAMIWMASKRENATSCILVFLCLVTSAAAICYEPTIEYGSTDCGWAASEGSTCTVTCYSAYTISGDSSLTCSSGGYGTLPTCTLTGASLGSIIGGSVGAGVVAVLVIWCCCKHCNKKKTTVTVTEYQITRWRIQQ